MNSQEDYYIIFGIWIHSAFCNFLLYRCHTYFHNYRGGWFACPNTANWPQRKWLKRKHSFWRPGGPALDSIFLKVMNFRSSGFWKNCGLFESFPWANSQSRYRWLPAPGSLNGRKMPWLDEAWANLGKACCGWFVCRKQLVNKFSKSETMQTKPNMFVFVCQTRTRLWRSSTKMVGTAWTSRFLEP